MDFKDIPEKIKDRIKKLDAMASNNPNLNETEVAIKKLEALLREHELSMSDLQFEESRYDDNMTHETFVTGDRKKQRSNIFETFLAREVSNYYNLYITRAINANSITFYGRGQDIELAKNIYRILYSTFMFELRKAQEEERVHNFGRLSRGFNSSFKKGFLNGVRDMFKELTAARKKANVETKRELILVTDKALAESYANDVLRIKPKKGPVYCWNPGRGYKNGYSAGRRANLEEKLT